MTTIKTKLLTADDLMLLSRQGVGGELVRGILQIPRSIMPEYHAPRVNLERAIQTTLDELGAGRFLKRAGVWLDGNPSSVRKADIAYLSAEDLRVAALNNGYPETTPSLLADFVTPTDYFSDVSENAQMWSDNGVPLVWVAYLGARTIDVYKPDGGVTTLADSDILDGGDVLPGFSCRVSDVFHQ